MVERVLMIAFHYPPMRGSSGIQRTLGFAHHLPRFGWEAQVLSAHPRAYPQVSPDEPDGAVDVERCFALDTGRQLALKGRYPALLALPDRWIGWWLGAVPAGLRLIRRVRPSIIWSTYPIATAHLIALTLHRLSGIPWVADMRDPMLDGDYPPDPRTRKAYQAIEAASVTRCASVVCTTAGARAIYRARYPQLPAQRFDLIENAFDEADFTALAPTPRDDTRVTLLHSGLIYPSERDPRALFGALAALQARGQIDPGRLRIILRASGDDGNLRGLIARFGIGALVELAPPLPYRAALAEMLSVDGLLLLQAANCNAQIPAKLYEYLRARRPILALTDPAGDSAACLRACGIDTIAPLDCQDAISAALRDFLALLDRAAAPLASPSCIATHTRAARSAQLATLFNHIRESR